MTSNLTSQYTTLELSVPTSNVSMHSANNLTTK